MCDWLLLLQKKGAEIRREEFTRLAQEFGLLKAMQVLAHLCVKHLDTPRELFPFDMGQDDRYSQLMLHDILAGGNFGFYRPNTDMSSGWKGKWNRYKSSISRARVFAPIAPSHIAVLPMTKLWVRIKLTWKNRK